MELHLAKTSVTLERMGWVDRQHLLVMESALLDLTALKVPLLKYVIYAKPECTTMHMEQALVIMYVKKESIVPKELPFVVNAQQVE